MEIGANIRRLRRQLNVTQEQLAAALNVSFQAVSKWENGIALPDITLVPRLAAYFNVSTDELLSFDAERMRSEIEAISAEAFAYRETDAARSREILEKGLKNYPDNDVLLNDMLYAIDYSSEPDRTIELALRLIAKTEKPDVKYDALRFLAYAYHAKSDEAAAVAALEQVPQLYFTRLSETAFITTGARRREAAEKQRWISLETLVQMQWKLAECSEADGDIQGAVKYASQALDIIGAMNGEERASDFMVYRDFINKQLARLEKMLES